MGRTYIETLFAMRAGPNIYLVLGSLEFLPY